MKPPLFSCLTSRVADNGSLYGRFLLGPLPIDISLTVATVLRRSLLHSQPSFTIVSAEIEGASHEYASLPGIQESVLEILLNLGEIVLTSSQRNFLNPNFRTSKGTVPFELASIRVSGPCVVRAKDINWPKGILCVKPETYIATVSSNETLAMRIKIACSLSKNQKIFYEIEESKSLASVSPTFDNLTKINSSFDSTSESETNEKTSAIGLVENTNVTEDGTSAEQVQASATSKAFNEFEFFKLQEAKNQATETSEAFETSAYHPLHSQSLTIQKENLTLAKNLAFLESYSTRKEKLTALLFSGRTKKQDVSQDKVLTNSQKAFTTVENVQKNSVIFSVFPEGQTFSNHFVSENIIIDSDQNTGDVFSEDLLQELELDSNEQLTEIEQQSSFFNQQSNSKSFRLFTEKNKESVELAVSSSSYPVEKVNFLIERDDELAGYRHRIILEVWTNGSFSPRQAVFESIGSIIKLIYNFREPLRNTLNDNDLFCDSTLS